MSQMCYMSGYGVSMGALHPLLKEEYQEYPSSEIIDEIDKKENSLFGNFNGEEDYIYIANISPYEESPFKSIEEIDNYFYEKLKPFLKVGTSVEHLSDLLDDVFDWEYC